MARPAGADDPWGSTFVPTLHTDTYPFINPEKGDASDIKVLVTGASKGIGRATVQSFARAGASHIALLARSNLDSVANEVIQAAKQAGRKEPKVLKLQADMCDVVAIDEAMKRVGQEFQSLDVAVNNASRLETYHYFAETDVNDWWSSWEVNVKGTFIISRSALPLLLKSKLKTVMTISSAGALTSK